MPTTRAYAVIIGVADYSRYRGREADNLPGSDEDAQSWRRVCQHPDILGMPREHIRFLAVDERGRKVKGADGKPTAAAIRRALAWLADRLAAAGGGETHDAFGPQMQASGLVTFSGHGFSVQSLSDAPLGSTLFLAPTDLGSSAGGPTGAMSLAELDAILQSRGRDTWPLVGVSHGVTWAIDACYSTLDAARVPALHAPPPPDSDALAALAADAPGLVAMWQRAIYGRVMLGSRPWGDTWQIPAGRGSRGAFTLALTTLLRQWRPRWHAGVQYVGCSYGDLMERTQALLDALGVPQRPALVGLPRLELQAFLRPGNDIAEDHTSAAPDAKRRRGQISSDTQYGYRVFVLWGAPAGTSPTGTGWTRVGLAVQSSYDATSSVCGTLFAGTETWRRYRLDAATAAGLADGVLRMELAGNYDDVDDLDSALQSLKTGTFDANKRASQVIPWNATSSLPSGGSISVTTDLCAPDPSTAAAADPPLALRVQLVDTGGAVHALKYLTWVAPAPAGSATPQFFATMQVPEQAPADPPPTEANFTVSTSAPSGGAVVGRQRFNSTVPTAPNGTPLTATVSWSTSPPATWSSTNPTAFCAGNWVRYTVGYMQDASTVQRQGAYSAWVQVAGDSCVVQFAQPEESKKLAIFRQVARAGATVGRLDILGTAVVSQAPGWSWSSAGFTDTTDALAGPAFPAGSPIPAT